MTTNEELTTPKAIGRGFNWQLFLQDNLTGSWMQTVTVLLLAIITGSYVYGKYEELPIVTAVVVALWILGIVSIIVSEIFHKPTAVSRWLKQNLLTSFANSLLTLFVVLVLVSAVNGIWQWSYVNANFNPAETAPEFRSANGATWGVLWGARKLLMTGWLEPIHSWRVWLGLGFILIMWLFTYITSRPALKEKLRVARMVLNGFWLLSPVVLYILLAGISEGAYNVTGTITGVAVLGAIYALLWSQKVIPFSWGSIIGTVVAWPLLYTIWWFIGNSGQFPPIDPDKWGGLLLTLIIASSVIVLAFPLGMILALARRSEVFGVPAWLIWPVAVAATLWGFTTTPELLATSRNLVEQIMSFWPVIILAIAYMIHRVFNGNIVAGVGTTFIELIRSVPLITLLFMGIVMAPFFSGEGVSIPKPWLVIVGYTLFSSAYMAEAIRGGLQAIPKGQYEASDALGFNGSQKMRFIILPQALRIVIPAIVGQFIGAFKSSSLVSIVGLFDFLGINRSIVSNPAWLGLRLELYVFMAIIYFTGSFLMSSYSRKLEVQLGLGDR
ncbi:MAG: amino acid ABC transporter permease [Anaerolineae bacterium]|jgi:general L-amino acid transport system permease protein|nr:amino acid ABC transporter permease [Anaerolineae bacterium]MBT7189524.1 amino acid ABC transporter permease [Anaerolineae bacterium]MBT7990031.1 amino acid ABC transporter permease [Anaerolineae bacterium]